MKPFAKVLTGLSLLTVTMPAHAWQDGWSYRTKVTLTPSQTGASGEIGAQPVLIRLHSGNFAFKDAKPDGSDLRIFAGDDKTPFKFQVEKWDAASEVALIWVQVPGLTATGATPVYFYYGNADATPAGDAKGAFAGRSLVWHFAEAGAPQDASGNGTSGSAGGARDPNGLIGQALKLDGGAGIGLAPGFTLTAPATVSLWVKPNANAGGTLFAVPGGLTIGMSAGTPYLDVAGQRVAAPAPLSADGWTHLAAVADGKQTTFYVAGQPAGSVPGALPVSGGQATLGQGFAGAIDELEIAKAALTPGALALAANSQGAGAKLASFDKAEQVDAGGHNYFGILFNALTADAWAVIAILAVMSVISWVVMISKGLLLARTASANDAFLDAYEKASERQSDHDGLADVAAGGGALHSSIGHLYRIGQRELKKRLAEHRASGSRFAVRSQSIAAIRAALDAAQMRENQRLNRWMVLLTIAISGGPFIGLLGTVLGVMITFAAVAAAGDVNINAIAPGIAAALLATVAGLAVAIPALFGYNYLLSRVGEIDADNQIFVDELEKRIAETYEDAPLPLAAE